MKPICIPCRRFFRQMKSGFYFTEAMPVGPGTARPGNADPEQWKPYKIWAGDLWVCEGCRASIISGTGLAPVSEHYKPDFAETMERLGADQFQVNDC